MRSKYKANFALYLLLIFTYFIPTSHLHLALPDPLDPPGPQKVKIRAGRTHPKAVDRPSPGTCHRL